MPDQETAAVHAPATVETDQWVEDPYEELPPRPRRHLLAPVPLALLGVLLIACGFIGGVLVEKGQTSSSSTGGSSAAGLASRFAALRGASGGASTGTGATVGQVAYVDGSTLYVTNAEGNTVKVRASASSTVTKAVTANVKGIRPGETVVIMGTRGASGAIDAESIRVGGGAGAGLGALFGSSGRRSSSGNEPALFGKGG